MGTGFAVVGKVTATNDLPYENQLLQKKSQSLKFEQDSLLERIAVNRKHFTGCMDHYQSHIGRLEFQNNTMIESLMSKYAVETTSGPWPREE